ncbi:MAG: glycosyltransferase [Planctomycetota bacterium]|nr:MAG: glycosyltransferase [Planctomycetota bacterium]
MSLNITLINTSDLGGASKSCQRLFWGLLSSNFSSSLLLLNNHSLDHDFVRSFMKEGPQFLSNSKLARLKRGANRLWKEMQIRQFYSNQPRSFSPHISRFDLTYHPAYQKADILNLHWVSHFLDFPSFFTKNNKPIVWTLHDMFPFTGGYHYDEDENISSHVSYLRKQEKLKEKWYQDQKIIFVAPSKWMYNEARSSAVLQGKAILHIPYGVDTQLYRPLDQGFCRNILRIQNPRLPVILFVAQNIRDKRKGFSYLVEALKQIKEPICLLAVGKKPRKSFKNHLPPGSQEYYVGTITDEALMSIIYNTADLFVIPSLQDNLPNTVLESLACGTPVVGFQVGGIPDMVNNGENGFLAPLRSSESLFEAIELGINNKWDRNQISIWAKTNFSLEKQAKAYIKLFKRIAS